MRTRRSSAAVVLPPEDCWDESAPGEETGTQSEACRDLPRRRGKGKKTIVLEAAILAVVDSVEGKMSPRQVYYQCVSHHPELVENSKAACDRVEKRLCLMREEGLVDDERIVDRGRAKHHRQGWESAREVVEAVAVQYRQDMWTTQEIVPMVSIEKAALEGVFAQAADKYGVSLWPLRGQPSRSFCYEWAKEIQALNDEGRAVAILYAGDWDPSGLDIERATRKKLDGFGAKYTWTRIGILPEDFEAFTLVELPIKKSDKKWKKFAAAHGERCAEVDALPPDELQRRVHDGIEPYIDEEKWEEAQRTADVQRESLDLVVGNWDAALAAAKGTGT